MSTCKDHHCLEIVNDGSSSFVICKRCGSRGPFSISDQNENTDRELWRENKDDYHGDSIFVTKEGKIGMNCGGHVKVKTIKEWFNLIEFKPIDTLFVAKEHWRMGT